MEAVHKANCRPWISDKINVKDFLMKWTSSLGDVVNVLPCCEEKSTQEMSKILGISLESTRTLEEECGIQALSCEEDGDFTFVKNFEIPPGVNLDTLRSQKEDMERRNNDSSYRAQIYAVSKYRNYPTMTALGFDKDQKDSNHVEGSVNIEMPEVILTVQVFRPEKQISGLLNKTPTRTPMFTVDQEMAVLGSQYLTDLRDAINCVSDIATPGDFSENPGMPQTPRSHDLYKSGFFYINATFYNDMRDPNNRDYSEVIQTWAKEKGRGIGPFDTRQMEHVRFINLELQLGYPYLYLHQGNCEHLVVFSDMRLVHSDDCQSLDSYPLYQRLCCKKRVICMVCHIHTARWVTCNNRRLPEDPYFFCDKCFYAFNYTVNKKKIDSFTAHPFFDRTAII